MAFSVSIEPRRGRGALRRRISLVSFILLLGGLFLLKSFGRGGGVDVKLTQEAPDKSVVLSRGPGQGEVYSLRVRISGELEGEGTVSLVADGQSYRTGALSGNVDLDWRQDWYSDSAELRFVLNEGSGGVLRVNHQFRDH